MPPDYIVNNWTDELLNVMVEKMVERKHVGYSGLVVSDKEMFRAIGAKHGN